MKNIQEICRNIDKYIPSNRIDGVFIGDTKSLVNTIYKKIKKGYYIYIVGDIKDTLLNGNFIIVENCKYIIQVTEEFKRNFSIIFEKWDIEIFYLLDDNCIPVILIEDFPQDITLNINKI